MKIAILSDVHANLEALQAVFADLSTRGADDIVCLGDCVGYGGSPRECLEFLFDKCSTIIAGNHDLAAAGILSDERFNEMGRVSVRFARQRITLQQQHRLRQLPIEKEVEGVLLVHSSPLRAETFPYIQHPRNAEEAFRDRSFRVACFGHTHVPVTFRFIEQQVTTSLNPVTQLLEGSYLCNVGSVGQPRDRDPRASYGILDTQKGELRRYRVEYDIEAASARIAEAGLPEFLGRRLTVGV